jgi:hypothetical protein
MSIKDAFKTTYRFCFEEHLCSTDMQKMPNTKAVDNPPVLSAPQECSVVIAAGRKLQVI